MMNMKKTLALLLAAVMVLGMFPFGAMAEETATHLDTCLEGCALEDCACPCHTLAPAAEEPQPEQPKQEEPKQEEPKQEEPKQEEPKQEEPKQEEPKQEEPKQEQPQPEQPKQEQPKQEEPKQEEPKQEEPKQEQPKQEEPKQEQPKQEQPQPEQPKQEEPKQEQPTCTCTPVEGVHAEGCALYGDKAEDSVHTGDCNDACEVEDCECECHAAKKSSFDADAAYKHLMSLENKTAIEEYLSSLTDEQCLQISNLITEEDGLVLGSRMGYVIEAETYRPLKSYTNVGPLMPPVKVPARTFRLLKNSGSSENGLILSKVSTPVDGGYKITLEAYTTGTVTNSSVSVPTDIVLVLDESGSMADNMYQYKKTYSIDTGNTYYIKNGDTYTAVRYCGYDKCECWKTGLHIDLFIINFHWGSPVNDPMTSETDTAQGHIQFYERDETSTSKRDALENAATQFVNSVYNDATNNNVDHRIAVIGFAGDGASRIKIGLVDDIRNNRGNVNTNGTILYAVNNLNANGGTYIEDGMSNAKTAFDNAAITSSTTRNRVVVVFTDGVPGSGSWGNSTIRDSANPAISTAKDLKNTYGATVYTIGMLDDADPTLPVSDEDNDAARTNKFLHYLSTNYPNAVSMSDGGSGGGNKGYYLAASDADSLDTIFQKIANQISTPTIQLDGDTVIKDIVAPQFNIPSGAVINTYTAAYDGSNFSSRVEEKISTSISGDTVTVTGFNFNDNFISTTGRGTDNNFYGKKLIIEFVVTVDSGFLGGNGVPTNSNESGVYSDGKLVEAFGVPNVDVPIKTITPVTQDQNVYLLNKADVQKLLNGTDARIGGKNNDYVTAWYEIYDGDRLIATYAIYSDDSTEWIPEDNTNLTPEMVEDKTYTVKCTLHSINDGKYQNAVSEAIPAKVNVFLPTVTWKDTEVGYNQIPDYEGENDKIEDNLVSVTWKHGNTLDTNVKMLNNAAAPELIYTYDPKATALKAESHVTITNVEIGETDVTQYVTHEHKNCTIDGCKWDADDHTDNCNFIVHLATFDLTITKAGVKDEDSNAAFVFNVSGNGINMNVVIYGNKSVTIKNLPAGEYTVNETSGYWRYTLDTTEQKASAANASITFTNNFKTNQWLDGIASVTNKFTGDKSNSITR